MWGGARACLGEVKTDVSVEWDSDCHRRDKAYTANRYTQNRRTCSAYMCSPTLSSSEIVT